MSTNTAKAEKKERELLEFEVTKTEPFKESYRVEVTTATKLTCLFDKFFKEVFSDYHKCQLIPINNPMTHSAGFELNLLFRPHADATEEFVDDKVAAFVLRSESEKSAVNNTMFRNLKKTGMSDKSINRYMISQPATELLRTFFLDQFTLRDQRNLFEDPNPKRYCNLGLIGERTVQDEVNYMRTAPLIENLIMHIDVNKILMMIKGSKGENGERYFYSIRPIKDMYANIPNSGGMVPIKSETVIDILRLNEAEWDELNASLGATQRNQEISSPVQNVKYY